MKTLRATWFSLAVVAPALMASADDKGKVRGGDFAKFQGVWTGLAGRGAEQNIPVVFTIKDEEVVIKTSLPNGKDVEQKGEIKLDEAARPHKNLTWIKFTNADGRTIADIPGLYKFEDKDTIIICNGRPGTEHPTEFKASETGDPYPHILTLKRKTE